MAVARLGLVGPIDHTLAGRDNCVFCHGVPGVDRGGNAKNLGYSTSAVITGLDRWVFKGPTRFGRSKVGGGPLLKSRKVAPSDASPEAGLRRRSRRSKRG
jgi:hypothetical protein